MSSTQAPFVPSSRSTTTSPTEIRRLVFWPNQSKAWEATERVIALVGGTGGGKTIFGPRWVWKHLQGDEPDQKALVIGLGYDTHIKQVLMPKTEEFLNFIGEPFRSNYSDYTIEMVRNSAVIRFGSSEAPKKIEGEHNPKCAWMDEAGYMPYESWEIVRRRTAGAGGNPAQILITTIPYFAGWLKTEVQDKWLAGDSSILWLHVRTTDNPLYPREEIEWAKANLPAHEYESRYEGNFAKPEGVIFDRDGTTDVIVESFNVPEDWPCYAGHDWGFKDPTAGVWARLSPEGVLYITAEYEEHGDTIDTHVERWKAPDEYGNEPVVDEAFGDPSNPELMLRALDCGYPVTPANNDILGGINAVYELITSDRLKVFRGCQKWISHRANYVWAHDARDKSKFKDKPQDPQPARHMMDATRYLVMGIKEMMPQSEMAILATHRS